MAEQKHYKTIFISDIHLGTKPCKAEYLCDFLKSTTADKYYFIGDIVDGWSLSSQWYWPERHNEVIRDILKLVRQKKAVYIPGNHDEAIRKFAPMNFGDLDIKLHDEHYDSSGRKMLVIHGDIFDNLVTKNKFLYKVGSIAYDTIVSLDAAHADLLRKMRTHYWSLSSFIRGMSSHAKRAEKAYEEAASSYAKAKGFDGIICGHIHKAKINNSKIDGQDILYINDGDWVESCTAVVEDDNGKYKILNWVEEMRRNGKKIPSENK